MTDAQIQEAREAFEAYEARDIYSCTAGERLIAWRAYHAATERLLPRIAEQDAEIARLRACEAALREYIAALDNSEDPQAVGSTCRLIRAEHAVRDLIGGGE